FAAGAGGPDQHHARQSPRHIETVGVGLAGAGVAVDLVRDTAQGFGAGVVFQEEPQPSAVFVPAAVAVRGDLVAVELGNRLFAAPRVQTLAAGISRIGGEPAEPGTAGVGGQLSEGLIHPDKWPSLGDSRMRRSRSACVDGRGGLVPFWAARSSAPR